MPIFLMGNNSKEGIILFSNDSTVTKKNLHEYYKDRRPQPISSYNILEVVHYQGGLGEEKQAVAEYLKAHPEFSWYVILVPDDWGFDFIEHTLRYDTENHETVGRRLMRTLSYGYWWKDEQYFRRLRRETERDGFVNVIFLDIDGVLNKEDYKDEDKVHEERVVRLKKIVAATDAEIVLTNSWRNYLCSWINEGGKEENGSSAKAYRRLYELFAKHGLYIADRTDSLDTGPYSRPLEIRTWFTNRMSLKNFVIIDDDGFWQWNWLAPHFVQTMRTSVDEYGRNFDDRGLEDDNVEEAIKILKMVSTEKTRY